MITGQSFKDKKLTWFWISLIVTLALLLAPYIKVLSDHAPFPGILAGVILDSILIFLFVATIISFVKNKSLLVKIINMVCGLILLYWMGLFLLFYIAASLPHTPGEQGL